MSWQSWLHRLWASFSYVGLVLATLFFSASLSPSLLPRHFAVQGVLSGVALAVGYGLGVGAVLLWSFLEFPPLGAKTQRIARRVTTVGAALVAMLSLWRATVWQDSIRELMEMPALEDTYAPYVALIAVVVGAGVIGFVRIVWKSCRLVDGQLKRFLPRRISYVLSAVVVGLILLTVANRIIARQALHVADAVFLKIDAVVDEGIEPPADSRASGSDGSLIAWDSIGRQGKDFIVAGPSEEQLSRFWGREVVRPLRVYVGLRSAETAEKRAKLALEELKRVGGFERSVLVVATPTGTGWLDPGAVDTLEFLHAGDTAIVSMQYSYLPSWITILVEPDASRDAARTLFDEIYGHWKTLAADSRPRLYLHGLSLGSLGSEVCADLFTLFDDPIQGGVWSGPPFPSTKWSAVTKDRNSGSPAWLPTFRDGRMVRFTGQKNSLEQTGDRWGKMRFVYIQYASDPMVFFAPELFFQEPDWLVGKRGPDVSAYLAWYPIVTFLQIGFDLPMATSVPLGYGHNYAPASYIDAWIEVTEPDEWSAGDSARLKRLLAD
ncbi:MAG: hypothetical protein GXY83_21690 [Rhodopirellula sp.]|nr:hypothetical protein [Rhodopirellula sp.]